MRNRYYDPVSGRFSQEDPIGLAGGLNQYGFAASDPVNFADPLGLLVCFQGSPQDVQRFKNATERATDTRIELDKNNCISRFSSGGDPAFDDARIGLADLIEDTHTYTIRFGRAYTSPQISPYYVDIFRLYNVLAYPAVNKSGKCVRNEVPWSLSEVVAHELYHHYSVPLTGHMNRSEQGAVDAENLVNQKIQRPLRCEY